MDALTISQLMTLTPGSPVTLTSGMVKGIGIYNQGTTEGQPWSLQELMIEDASGSIPVRISNHPEVPQDMIGRVLVFVAHRKSKGGLSGLKMDEESYVEGGMQKRYKLLHVSRSGEINEDITRAPDVPAEMVPQGQVPAQNLIPQQTQPGSIVQQVENIVQQVAELPTGRPPQVTETVKPGGMRIVELRYEKTVNTGNYCSEKLGVTLELDPGTKGVSAVAAAKKFVNDNLPAEWYPPNGRRIDGKFITG